MPILKLRFGMKNLRLSKWIKKLSKCPQKTDTSSLEDHRCSQRISDESKYLFDFVASSVWNARKQMTMWLSELHDNKNKYVDLFYAIRNCHGCGWIKSDKIKSCRRHWATSTTQQAATKRLKLATDKLIDQSSPKNLLPQLTVGYHDFNWLLFLWFHIWSIVYSSITIPQIVSNRFKMLKLYIFTASRHSEACRWHRGHLW